MPHDRLKNMLTKELAELHKFADSVIGSVSSHEMDLHIYAQVKRISLANGRFRKCPQKRRTVQEELKRGNDMPPVKLTTPL